jgi:6-phosphofructokinase 1
MAQRIGIITGGGDCAGLNAVIAAAVKSGLHEGYEFVGFERGWEGVLDRAYRPLDAATVSGISHLGGTILKTTNKGRFSAKAGAGENRTIDPEILDLAHYNLQELNIEGLIVIGGDGTLSGALQLAERGTKVVGVPKTIDNDLRQTDRTFGFSTAVEVAVEAIDRIHTTAASHERTIIVECMGRHTGWISLYAGLAGGANAILLPEFPFELENLIEFLRKRRGEGRPSNIIVIAEGVEVQRHLASHQGLSEDREMLLGGVSSLLMREMEAMAPGEFEMRNAILGHIQRGGGPNADDRILSKQYGAAAFQAFRDGAFNQMVCLHNGRMELVPIADAVDSLNRVTEDSPVFQAAQSMRIFTR